MIELEEALNRILSTIQLLEYEAVALTEAADRVLAEPIVSPVDLPRFDNSAMDGYAVRAADLAAASAERPASLQVRGKVAAGGVFTDKVAAGTCVRLFTGSPLPEGADAVVMQEDTRLDPSRPDTVWFLEAIRPAFTPVLGDAELILGLAASGEGTEGNAKIAGEHMGSIDEKSVRMLVEEILEGGRTAFEMRRLKYGF